jgi:hypothetical protein
MNAMALVDLVHAISFGCKTMLLRKLAVRRGDRRIWATTKMCMDPYRKCLVVTPSLQLQKLLSLKRELPVVRRMLRRPF